MTVDAWFAADAGSAAGGGGAAIVADTHRAAHCRVQIRHGKQCFAGHEGPHLFPRVRIVPWNHPPTVAVDCWLCRSTWVWLVVGRCVRFGPGDVALFFPMITSASSGAGGASRRLYVAFNERAPHRYLSEESTSAFRVSGVYPSFVIGRIVEVATRTAVEVRARCCHSDRVPRFALPG